MARAAADYGDVWRADDPGVYPSNESQHPGPIVGGVWGDLEDQYAKHIVRWDPARVLRKVATERAEVDAQRRILERPGPVCDCSESGPPMDPETRWTTPLPHHFDCASYETAKLLALPYAERDGYREEWRPE